MTQPQQQSTHEITRLLDEWAAERTKRTDELWSLVYGELRRIAGAYMRNERPDHTLQASALVNEAYLRAFEAKPFRWANRKHFFCAMASMMRRILVDHARECNAEKRRRRGERVCLENALMLTETQPADMLALHEALERLATLNQRQSQVVELRFFAGLTVEETAAMLEISAETVKLDWRFAKAWLQSQIRQDI